LVDLFKDDDSLFGSSSSRDSDSGSGSDDDDGDDEDDKDEGNADPKDDPKENKVQHSKQTNSPIVRLKDNRFTGLLELPAPFMGGEKLET